MRTLLPLLLILAFPAAGGLSFADEAERTSRTFDISEIVAPHRPRGHLHLGAPGSYDMFSAAALGMGIDDEPQSWASGDMVVELVQTLVEPESWQEDSAAIWARGRLLRVVNTPAVLRKVETFLQEIAGVAGRRARLRLAVLSGGEGTDASPPLASGSLETPFGLSRTIQVTNRVRYVGDYEVEIAQGSNISNPVVFDAEEGLMGEFVVHPNLAGDGLHVEGVVQFGRYEKMRRVELGRDEEYLPEPYRSDVRSHLGVLELPTFGHAQVHFNAVVPSGQTVVLPLRYGDRAVRFEVHAELVPGAPSSAFLDVGALTQRHMPVFFGLAPEADSPEGLAPRVWWYGEDEDALIGQSEEVVESIRQDVAPWIWEEDENASLSILNERTLVLRAPDGVRRDVSAFLRRQEESVATPITVELRVVSLEEPLPTGPIASLGDFTHEEIVAAGRVQTLSGRLASLMIGRTENFVMDYDVEVAQEARIAEPNVGQAFGGLVANVTPRRLMDGSGADVELLMLVSDLEVADPPFDPGAQFLGTIDKPKSHRALLDTSVRVQQRQTHAIDIGPDPRRPGRRLMVLVGATVGR